MLTKMTLLTLAATLACPSAFAETPPETAPTPFQQLQAAINGLEDRVAELEAAAPSAEVDGRTYCMMVNVNILRGIASTASETEDLVAVRRLASFSDGIFTAAVVSNRRIAQGDDGVVSLLPGASPDVLEASYSQSGRQLDLTFTDGTVVSWYASADGSVVHNNGLDHFGPFPNSLSLGLVRAATLVESDTCEDPAAS